MRRSRGPTKKQRECSHKLKTKETKPTVFGSADVEVCFHCRLETVTRIYGRTDNI